MLISCILASPPAPFLLWMMTAAASSLARRYIAISLFAKRPRYHRVLPQTQTPFRGTFQALYAKGQQSESPRIPGVWRGWEGGRAPLGT